MKNWPLKNCVVCGNTFQVTGCNHITCRNKECIRVNRNNKIRLKNLKTRPPENRVCKLCKTTFIEYKSNRPYCSKYCSKKARNKSSNRNRKKKVYARAKIIKPIVIIHCLFCGKKFQRKVSTQKFCSERCTRRPFISTRFKLLERDNFTCQYCGRKSQEVTLQIDHIIPVSKGGTSEYSNLITACIDCNIGKSDVMLDRK